MAGTDSVLVVASGDPEEIRTVAPADLTIAADGGLALALALGVAVDVVVGDMDSVDPVTLDAAQATGVRVVRHPTDKDETDLELALGLAAAEAPRRIHVVVGAGGRLDHAIANLAVLASPRWTPADVSADVGKARVWVVRGRRSLPLSVGDPLALQPVGGPAEGVTTGGLAFTLVDETLDPFAGRGVANVVVGQPVTVEVGSGVLLAISGPTPTTGPAAARDRG